MVPDGVYRVAVLLRDGSERAALAGTSAAGLGALLPAPATGRSVRSAADGVSAAWTDVADDLTAGLAQLATWVDGSVTAVLAVDDAAATSFRGIPR